MAAVADVAPTVITVPDTRTLAGDRTITKRAGEAYSNYSGKSENWAAVEAGCKAVAYDKIYRQLMTEPNTASVVVDTHMDKDNDHGEEKTFAGFEEWVVVLQNEHWDREKMTKRRLKWRAERAYKYVALIETRIV